MNFEEIVRLLAALAQASASITVNFSQVADLFAKMAAEGRTQLTPEEDAQMVAVRDAARAGYVVAIEATV